VIEKIGIDAPVSSYGLDENASPRVSYPPKQVLQSALIFTLPSSENWML